MMKIPGKANVNKSLAAVRKSLKGCLRQVNQQAGRFLARGDYARADSLVEVAKSVEAFRKEIEGLHSRWRGMRGSRQEASGGRQTPLWEYYQPILQALVDLGGAARVAGIETAAGRLLGGRLAEGDVDTMSGGRARWQVMIRRARRHMVKEGFLEGDSGLEWRITALGRKAATTGAGRKE